MTGLIFLCVLGVLSISNAFHFGAGRAHRSALRMMGEVSFVPGKIANSKVDATGMKLIDVEVPEDIAQGYSTPGQYLQLKVGDEKPGFYAVCSPPDKRNILTFLVKETDGSKAFTSLSAGGTCELSATMGSGFKTADNFDGYRYDFPTMRVLMLACGSGLAPIAAAIESGTLGLKDTGYNSLSARLGRLYVGAKTEAHLPLKDRYEAWGELGLEIIPVLSQAPDSPYRKGYVQDALKEDGVGVPRNTGVLMCGHRGMTEDAKEILLSAGVFEGRILLNF